MDQAILSIVFFRLPSGREPVREFLRDLPPEDRKAIGIDLKTVQFGWPLGMPLVRKMEAGLWEVRCRVSDGIVRVFFTVQAAHMVLLHAFVKKSQHTPATDLKTARDRLKQLRSEA